MFGKLLKQEFKSVGKWYLSLYAMTMGFATILGLWIKHISHSNFDDSTVWSVIFTMLIVLGFGAILASLGLSTLVLIIRRFKNNIYSQQGYLTMTLPVTTHQILISKLTAALIWSFLSALTVIAAFFTIVLSYVGFKEFQEGLHLLLTDRASSEIFKQIGLSNIIALGFSTITGTICNVLMVYLAIALGHLAESHRIFLSFIAYFVLYIFIIIATVMFISHDNSTVSANFNWFASIFHLILSLFMYFLTHYLIKNKLNIQ